MNITPDLSVKEVVGFNFKTAPIFQEYNIDYCCGGNKSISEAGREAGIDTEQLINELKIVAAQKDPDSEYINHLSLAELISYIVKRHHAYVHESIPPLKKNLEKVCQVHGEHHPELFKIRDLFNSSAGNLTMHMQKEEIILFPLIQRLESTKRASSVNPTAPAGKVANPISAMMAEHQAEGDRFDEIAKLADNYRLPADGCSTYEVTLKQLKDFEDDLHRHIHLENNILFPKAIKLDQSLA